MNEERGDLLYYELHASSTFTCDHPTIAINKALFNDCSLTIWRDILAVE